MLLVIFLLGLFLRAGAHSRHRLDGVHLKLAAVENPPFDNLILLPNGTYTVEGCNTEVVEWLSEKLNFTFSVLPVVDKILLERLGAYESAVYMVAIKEADGTLESFGLTPKRLEVISYTSMIAWAEPYSLVVPVPEFKSRLLAFIRPFEPMVWLCLAVSILLFVMAMSYFSLVYNQNLYTPKQKTIKNETRDNRHHLDNDETVVLSSNPPSSPGNVTSYISVYALYVVNVLTNHGSYTPYAQLSFRILAGCWVLATSVLVYGYSSVVVSSLTVPTLEPAVNSLEDLASTKDVSILIRQDSAIGQQILGAKLGLFKTLGDQARADADRLLCRDYSSMAKRFRSGRYAFPFLNSFNRDFVAKQFQEDNKCRYQVSPPLQLSTGYFFFLFQKGSKYTSAFSYGMNYRWQSGLTRRCAEGLISNKAQQCFVRKAKSDISDGQVKITLQDMTSAFLILGIGIGFALSVFLGELIHGYVRKMKT